MLMRRIDPLLFLALSLACSEAPKASDLPTIEVQNQGTGTAVPLAIAVPVGHKETLAVELALAASGEVNGTASADAALAPLTFAVHVEVTEVTDRGLRAELKVAELAVAKVPGEGSDMTRYAHNQVGKAIAKMPQLSGEMVVTPTGLVTKLELSAAKGVSNQQAQVVEVVRSTIAQLVVPRPTQAAAPASWHTSLEISRNGFPLEQAVALSLEQSGVIRATIGERSKASGAAPPGVYADDVQTEAYEGDGTGEVRVSPESLFPRSAHFEMSARTALAVDQAGTVDHLVSRARLTIKARTAID